MTAQTVADTAMRIAERFGVPVVIMAALLWMAREAATSLHNTVVVPMVQSHTEFISSTSETLHHIARAQERQAETLSEIAESQIEIRNAVIRTGTSKK